MIGLGAKLGAYRRLGPRSLARVGGYRLGLKVRLHPVFRITPAVQPAGALFTEILRPDPGVEATAAWRDRPWAFGYPLAGPTDQPPAWNRSLTTGEPWPNSDRAWSAIPAFAPPADVKTVWEASRFDWVLAFAQQAVKGDQAAFERLNIWLADWLDTCPPYDGPNWMCGQEASLRVLHLAMASRIFGTMDKPAPALLALVLTHLRRIQPTVSYALGQDNNHATSEAAALFVGGLWLAARATDPSVRREGQSLADQGRRMVEQSVSRLIFADGGFAQYSVVYHRVMLDALALAELFRRHFGAPAFKRATLDGLDRAAAWLDAMIEPTGGDAPNLGANDGAWLLPLGVGQARDFRPSVALASAMFRGTRRHTAAASSRGLLAWLDVDVSALPDGAPPSQTDFPDSGDLILRAGGLTGWLRAPDYRFRPSQCDALHLDLWTAGEAVFVDSGSYSYADPAPAGGPHLGSVEAHNTVQFDGLDQMPRISRFLLGAWIKARPHRVSAAEACATYAHHSGATHRRTVKLDELQAVITDEIAGYKDEAVLRWRTPAVLASEGKVLQGRTPVGRSFRIAITIDGQAVQPRLNRGRVSVDYLALKDVTVIEVFAAKPGVIVTTVTFDPA